MFLVKVEGGGGGKWKGEEGYSLLPHLFLNDKYSRILTFHYFLQCFLTRHTTYILLESLFIHTSFYKNWIMLVCTTIGCRYDWIYDMR